MTSTPGTDRRGGIQSIEKGAAILRVLQLAQNPMRLVEIAAAVDMSPSKARGYLLSLVRTGLVRQESSTGHYDLGEAALQLGLVALTRLDFLKYARDAMTELAEGLGETITLSVWSGEGAVVVDKIEGRRDAVYEIRIGSTVRLWPTATGRVFMAHLPQPLWEPALRNALTQAGQGRDALRDLLARLPAVREQGVAATPPASMPDFSAIAVPAFDHRGDLKGVLTVIGRAAGLDINLEGDPVRRAKEAAIRLSRRLGNVAR